MAPCLSIVTPRTDDETIAALTALLEDAKAGRVVGLAYIVLAPGGRYAGDVVGRANRAPLYTLGIARALENRIIELTNS